MYNNKNGNIHNGRIQDTPQMHNADEFVRHNLNSTASSTNAPTSLKPVPKQSTTSVLRQWRRPDDAKHVPPKDASFTTPKFSKVPQCGPDTDRSMSYPTTVDNPTRFDNPTGSEYSMYNHQQQQLSTTVPSNRTYFPHVQYADSTGYNRTSPPKQDRVPDSVVKYTSTQYYAQDATGEVQYRGTSYPVQGTPPLAHSATAEPNDNHNYAVMNQKLSPNFHYPLASPYHQKLHQEAAKPVHGEEQNIYCLKSAAYGVQNRVPQHANLSYSLQNQLDRRLSPQDASQNYYLNKSACLTQEVRGPRQTYAVEKPGMYQHGYGQSYLGQKSGMTSPQGYMGQKSEMTSPQGYMGQKSGMTSSQSYLTEKSGMTSPQGYMGQKSGMTSPQGYMAQKSGVISPQGYLAQKSGMTSPQSYLTQKPGMPSPQEPKSRDYRQIVPSPTKKSPPFPILEQRLSAEGPFYPEYGAAGYAHQKYGTVMLPGVSPTQKVPRDNYLSASGPKFPPEDIIPSYAKFYPPPKIPYEQNHYLLQMNQMQTRLNQNLFGRSTEPPRDVYMDQPPRALQKTRIHPLDAGQYAGKSVVIQKPSSKDPPGEYFRNYPSLPKQQSVIQSSKMLMDSYPARTEAMRETYAYSPPLIHQGRPALAQYPANYLPSTKNEHAPGNISPRRTFQENMPVVVIPPQCIGLSKVSPRYSLPVQDYPQMYPNFLPKESYYPGNSVKPGNVQYQGEQLAKQPIHVPRSVQPSSSRVLPTYPSSQYHQIPPDCSEKVFYPPRYTHQVVEATNPSYQAEYHRGFEPLNEAAAVARSPYAKKELDIGKSLKEYLESWEDDEDIVANLPDVVLCNNLPQEKSKHVSFAEPITEAKSISSTEKLSEDESSREPQPLYILDSTNISSEALSQYLHIQQIDHLPANIKGYYTIPNVTASLECIAESSQTSEQINEQYEPCSVLKSVETNADLAQGQLESPERVPETPTVTPETPVLQSEEHTNTDVQDYSKQRELNLLETELRIPEITAELAETPAETSAPQDYSLNKTRAAEISLTNDQNGAEDPEMPEESQDLHFQNCLPQDFSTTRKDEAETKYHEAEKHSGAPENTETDEANSILPRDYSIHKQSSAERLQTEEMQLSVPENTTEGPLLHPNSPEDYSVPMQEEVALNLSTNRGKFPVNSEEIHLLQERHKDAEDAVCLEADSSIIEDQTSSASKLQGCLLHRSSEELPVPAEVQDEATSSSEDKVSSSNIRNLNSELYVEKLSSKPNEEFVDEDLYVEKLSSKANKDEASSLETQANQDSVDEDLYGDKFSSKTNEDSVEVSNLETPIVEAENKIHHEGSQKSEPSPKTHIQMHTASVIVQNTLFDDKSVTKSVLDTLNQPTLPLNRLALVQNTSEDIDMPLNRPIMVQNTCGDIENVRKCSKLHSPSLQVEKSCTNLPLDSAQEHLSPFIIKKDSQNEEKIAESGSESINTIPIDEAMNSCEEPCQMLPSKRAIPIHTSNLQYNSQDFNTLSSNKLSNDPCVQSELNKESNISLKNRDLDEKTNIYLKNSDLEEKTNILLKSTDLETEANRPVKSTVIDDRKQNMDDYSSEQSNNENSDEQTEQEAENKDESKDRIREIETSDSEHDESVSKSDDSDREETYLDKDRLEDYSSEETIREDKVTTKRGIGEDTKYGKSTIYSTYEGKFGKSTLHSTTDDELRKSTVHSTNKDEFLKSTYDSTNEAKFDQSTIDSTKDKHCKSILHSTKDKLCKSTTKLSIKNEEKSTIEHEELEQNFEVNTVSDSEESRGTTDEDTIAGDESQSTSAAEDIPEDEGSQETTDEEDTIQENESPGTTDGSTIPENEDTIAESESQSTIPENESHSTTYEESIIPTEESQSTIDEEDITQDEDGQESEENSAVEPVVLESTVKVVHSTDREGTICDLAVLNDAMAENCKENLEFSKNIEQDKSVLQQEAEQEVAANISELDQDCKQVAHSNNSSHPLQEKTILSVQCKKVASSNNSQNLQQHTVLNEQCKKVASSNNSEDLQDHQQCKKIAISNNPQDLQEHTVLHEQCKKIASSNKVQESSDNTTETVVFDQECQALQTTEQNTYIPIITHDNQVAVSNNQISLDNREAITGIKCADFDFDRKINEIEATSVELNDRKVYTNLKQWKNTGLHCKSIYGHGISEPVENIAPKLEDTNQHTKLNVNKEDQHTTLHYKDTRLQHEDRNFHINTEDIDRTLQFKDEKVKYEDMYRHGALYCEDKDFESSFEQARGIGLQKEETVFENKVTVFQNEETVLETEETGLQNEEMANQNEEIAIKNEDIANQNEEMAIKNEDIAIKNEEIAIQNEDIAIKNEDIAIKNEDIAIKNEDIAIKNEDIVFQNDVIALEYEDTVLKNEDMTIQNEDMALPNEDILQNEDMSIPNEDIALQNEDIALQKKDTTVQVEDTVLQSEDTILQFEDTILQTEESILQNEDTILQSDDTSLQSKDTSSQSEDPTLQSDNTSSQFEDTSLQTSRIQSEETAGDVTMREASSTIEESIPPLKKPIHLISSEDNISCEAGKSIMSDPRAVSSKNEDLVEKLISVHEDTLISFDELQEEICEQVTVPRETCQREIENKLNSIPKDFTVPQILNQVPEIEHCVGEITCPYSESSINETTCPDSESSIGEITSPDSENSISQITYPHSEHSISQISCPQSEHSINEITYPQSENSVEIPGLETPMSQTNLLFKPLAAKTNQQNQNIALSESKQLLQTDTSETVNTFANNSSMGSDINVSNVTNRELSVYSRIEATATAVLLQDPCKEELPIADVEVDVEAPGVEEFFPKPQETSSENMTPPGDMQCSVIHSSTDEFKESKAVAVPEHCKSIKQGVSSEQMPRSNVPEYSRIIKQGAASEPMQRSTEPVKEHVTLLSSDNIALKRENRELTACIRDSNVQTQELIAKEMLGSPDENEICKQAAELAVADYKPYKRSVIPEELFTSHCKQNNQKLIPCQQIHTKETIEKQAQYIQTKPTGQQINARQETSANQEEVTLKQTVDIPPKPTGQQINQRQEIMTNQELTLNETLQTEDKLPTVPANLIQINKRQKTVANQELPLNETLETEEQSNCASTLDAVIEMKQSDIYARVQSVSELAVAAHNLEDIKENNEESHGEQEIIERVGTMHEVDGKEEMCEGICTEELVQAEDEELENWQELNMEEEPSDENIDVMQQEVPNFKNVQLQEELVQKEMQGERKNTLQEQPFTKEMQAKAKNYKKNVQLQEQVIKKERYASEMKNTSQKQSFTKEKQGKGKNILQKQAANEERRDRKNVIIKKERLKEVKKVESYKQAKRKEIPGDRNVLQDFVKKELQNVRVEHAREYKIREELINSESQTSVDTKLQETAVEVERIKECTRQMEAGKVNECTIRQIEVKTNQKERTDKGLIKEELEQKLQETVLNVKAEKIKECTIRQIEDKSKQKERNDEVLSKELEEIENKVEHTSSQTEVKSKTIQIENKSNHNERNNEDLSKEELEVEIKVERTSQKEVKSKQNKRREDLEEGELSDESETEESTVEKVDNLVNYSWDENEELPTKEKIVSPLIDTWEEHEELPSKEKTVNPLIDTWNEELSDSTQLQLPISQEKKLLFARRKRNLEKLKAKIRSAAQFGSKTPLNKMPDSASAIEKEMKPSRLQNQASKTVYADLEASPADGICSSVMCSKSEMIDSTSERVEASESEIDYSFGRINAAKSDIDLISEKIKASKPGIDVSTFGRIKASKFGIDGSSSGKPNATKSGMIDSTSEGIEDSKPDSPRFGRTNVSKPSTAVTSFWNENQSIDVFSLGRMGSISSTDVSSFGRINDSSKSDTAYKNIGAFSSSDLACSSYKTLDACSKSNIASSSYKILNSYGKSDISVSSLKTLDAYGKLDIACPSNKNLDASGKSETSTSYKSTNAPFPEDAFHAPPLSKRSVASVEDKELFINPENPRYQSSATGYFDSLASRKRSQSYTDYSSLKIEFTAPKRRYSALEPARMVRKPIINLDEISRNISQVLERLDSKKMAYSRRGISSEGAERKIGANHNFVRQEPSKVGATQSLDRMETSEARTIRKQPTEVGKTEEKLTTGSQRTSLERLDSIKVGAPQGLDRMEPSEARKLRMQTIESGKIEEELAIRTQSKDTLLHGESKDHTNQIEQQTIEEYMIPKLMEQNRFRKDSHAESNMILKLFDQHLLRKDSQEYTHKEGKKKLKHFEVSETLQRKHLGALPLSLYDEEDLAMEVKDQKPRVEASTTRNLTLDQNSANAQKHSRVYNKFNQIPTSVEDEKSPMQISISTEQVDTLHQQSKQCLKQLTTSHQPPQGPVNEPSDVYHSINRDGSSDQFLTEHASRFTDVEGDSSSHQSVDNLGADLMETLDCVDSSHQSVENLGKGSTETLECVASSDQDVDSSRHSVDSSHQYVDSSYQSVGSSHRSVDSSHRSVDSSHQSIDNLHQSVDHRGDDPMETQECVASSHQLDNAKNVYDPLAAIPATHIEPVVVLPKVPFNLPTKRLAGFRNGQARWSTRVASKQSKTGKDVEASTKIAASSIQNKAEKSAEETTKQNKTEKMAEERMKLADISKQNKAEQNFDDSSKITATLSQNKAEKIAEESLKIADCSKQNKTEKNLDESPKITATLKHCIAGKSAEGRTDNAESKDNQIELGETEVNIRESKVGQICVERCKDDYQTKTIGHIVDYQTKSLGSSEDSQTKVKESEERKRISEEDSETKMQESKDNQRKHNDRTENGQTKKTSVNEDGTCKEDSEKLEETEKDCQKFEETVEICQKLEETEEKCQKYEETEGNCQKLEQTEDHLKFEETEENCQQLEETEKYCQKLAKTEKNCQKLAKTEHRQKFEETEENCLKLEETEDCQTLKETEKDFQNNRTTSTFGAGISVVSGILDSGVLQTRSSTVEVGKSNRPAGISNVKDDSSNIEIRVLNVEVRKSNTEVGKSNIEVGKFNTEVGKSNLEFGKLNTEVAASNIDAEKSNTEAEIFNIQADSSNSIASSSNIQDSPSNIEAGISNVNDSPSNIQAATSNIKEISSKRQASPSNIQEISLDSQASPSNIQQSPSNIEAGISNVNDSSSNIQAATSNIEASPSDRQGSPSNIQTETSNIKSSLLNTQVGTSNIKASSLNTQTGTLNIKSSSSNTETGTSNIKSSLSNVQTESSNIKSSPSNTPAGTASIEVGSSTIQDDSPKLQRTSTNGKSAASGCQSKTLNAIIVKLHSSNVKLGASLGDLGVAAVLHQTSFSVDQLATAQDQQSATLDQHSATVHQLASTVSQHVPAVDLRGASVKQLPATVDQQATVDQLATAVDHTATTVSPLTPTVGEQSSPIQSTFTTDLPTLANQHQIIQGSSSNVVSSKMISNSTGRRSFSSTSLGSNSTVLPSASSTASHCNTLPKVNPVISASLPNTALNVPSLRGTSHKTSGIPATYNVDSSSQQASTSVHKRSPTTYSTSRSYGSPPMVPTSPHLYNTTPPRINNPGAYYNPPLNFTPALLTASLHKIPSVIVEPAVPKRKVNDPRIDKPNAMQVPKADDFENKLCNTFRLTEYTKNYIKMKTGQSVDARVANGLKRKDPRLGQKPTEEDGYRRDLKRKNCETDASAKAGSDKRVKINLQDYRNRKQSNSANDAKVNADDHKDTASACKSTFDDCLGEIIIDDVLHEELKISEEITKLSTESVYLDVTNENVETSEIEVSEVEIYMADNMELIPGNEEIVQTSKDEEQVEDLLSESQLTEELNEDSAESNFTQNQDSIGTNSLHCPLEGKKKLPISDARHKRIRTIRKRDNREQAGIKVDSRARFEDESCPGPSRASQGRIKEGDNSYQVGHYRIKEAADNFYKSSQARIKEDTDNSYKASQSRVNEATDNSYKASQSRIKEEADNTYRVGHSRIKEDTYNSCKAFQVRSKEETDKSYKASEGRINEDIVKLYRIEQSSIEAISNVQPLRPCEGNQNRNATIPLPKTAMVKPTKDTIPTNSTNRTVPNITNPHEMQEEFSSTARRRLKSKGEMKMYRPKRRRKRFRNLYATDEDEESEVPSKLAKTSRSLDALPTGSKTSKSLDVLPTDATTMRLKTGLTEEPDVTVRLKGGLTKLKNREDILAYRDSLPSCSSPEDYSHLVSIDKCHVSKKKCLLRPNEENQDTHLVFVDPNAQYKCQLSKKKCHLLQSEELKDTNLLLEDGNVPQRQGTNLSLGGNVPELQGTDLSLEGNVPQRQGTNLSLVGNVPQLQSTDLSLEGNIPQRQGTNLSLGGNVPQLQSTNLSLEGNVPQLQNTKLSFDNVPQVSKKPSNQHRPYKRLKSKDTDDNLGSLPSCSDSSEQFAAQKLEYKCHINLNALGNKCNVFDTVQPSTSKVGLKLTLKSVRKQTSANNLDNSPARKTKHGKKKVPRKEHSAYSVCSSATNSWVVKNKVPKVIIKRNGSGYCAVSRDVSANPIWQPIIRVRRHKYIESLVQNRVDAP